MNECTNEKTNENYYSRNSVKVQASLDLNTRGRNFCGQIKSIISSRTCGYFIVRDHAYAVGDDPLSCS